VARARSRLVVCLPRSHFAHWFQPLTGGASHKANGLFVTKRPAGVIDSFSGKRLVMAETDGSSFPNGGLRETHVARGYTGAPAASLRLRARARRYCTQKYVVHAIPARRPCAASARPWARARARVSHTLPNPAFDFALATRRR
jgi:hypothetical protein